MKEGMVVVLEFTAFNTRSNDKLTIRDGDGTILMQERSGDCLPGKIWSRTNVVHLHFYTDRRYTRTGWSANWTASTPTGDHFVKNNFHFINKSNEDFYKKTTSEMFVASLTLLILDFRISTFRYSTF